VLKKLALNLIDNVERNNEHTELKVLCEFLKSRKLTLEKRAATMHMEHLIDRSLHAWSTFLKET
jgi:hypothetical protein